MQQTIAVQQQKARLSHRILPIFWHGAKKLGSYAILFLGITLLCFIIIHLAPGTPADTETLLNPLIDTDARSKLLELYGLNKPLYQQYFEWLGRLVRLDFGYSFSSDNHRQVWDVIKERLPLTLGMNLTVLLLTLFISIPIGVLSAKYKDKFFDKFMTCFVFIGFAMPSFWLASLLMFWLGIEYKVFPISGLTSLYYEDLTTFGKIRDVLWHLGIPLIVYSFGQLTTLSRFMRSSMLEVLRQEYLLTAKAKGLPERTILWRHALRNALLPVITLLGLSIPGLIGGSVIIETMFSLPGLGELFYTAVISRDYPLIMGNLVLVSLLTLFGNFIADMAYRIADPRTRN